MPDTKPVRIMVVEDHPPIIKAVQDYLSMMQRFEVGTVARTVEEARRIVKSNKLDATQWMTNEEIS